MSLNILIMEVVIALITITIIVVLMIKRKVNSNFSLIWILVALTAMLQAAFPQVLDHLCKWLGIGYPPTLIILAAIIVLLGTSVYLSSEVTVAQNKIMELSIQLSMLNDEMYDVKKNIKNTESLDE